LVVLPPEHPYSKDEANPAEKAARAILESRGNTPRLYRNTLVFLAADKVRMQDLDEGVRKYLAWASIVAEKESLDLSPYQVRQAETQRKAADGVVTARIPETYQWVLVPEQKSPHSAVSWQAVRAAGIDPLAVRASRRLKSDESLVATLGSTILRKHLDDVPLWRADHVEVRQLIEDFARYLYLPRLAGPDVLLRAIGDGVGLLTWQTDTFAYAESYDDAAGRYRGLRGGQVISTGAEDPGLLVKPDVAIRQLTSELAQPGQQSSSPVGISGDRDVDSRKLATSTSRVLRRFHGTVALDPERVGRDAGRIADEVIAHLVGQDGANVTVTLEIQAHLPNAASEQLVRTVTENSTSLKFSNHAFEAE
jgi:hypothetical protein